MDLKDLELWRYSQSEDPTMRWFCLIFMLSICRAAQDFRICSYNVQNFNMQKASNYKLIHTLTRVVSRCDVCLLQHVVDSDGKAVNKLLAALNRYDDFTYKAVSSQSLGNSPGDMQQYVFIYRTETVNLTGQHQYSSKQSFVREPFVVQFQSNRTAIKEFVLVPLHSEPSKAVHEIDRLYDVFQEVSKKWNNKNVMFLGDFHASCAYVTRSDRKKIRLFKNPNFSWLIGDKVDTTVTDDTNCAYDRIVVHGEPFLKAIRPFSAQVFNFAKDFKLSQTRVLEVSDHFPIEVRLKSSAPFLLQASPLLLLLLSVIGQFVL
ncbi:deoxyribonuclease-1-like isoform X2 [Acanthochromis polyacanthus]|uniref:deoxyribonuclease-1-like isoform X2 n=1 Tax=Acanthochromis polyacanthus TaxID=80966 RepID=UPI00223436A7|nr:deoxyribonuclease-1-like isoform X2 [Acanthochromis polyacanthus]